MKLPRDLSGEQLARSLVSLAYQVTRQTGSHLRQTTTEPSEHHMPLLNPPAPLAPASGPWEV